MLMKKSAVLIISLFIFSIIPMAVFSQGSKIIQGPPMSTPVLSTTVDIEWLWGEAVFVDSTNNQITVKYLDYETDTEKEMVIGVDEKTTYENSKTLNEINPGENVSIDYYVTPEGKKVAKNISLEKAVSSNTQKESSAMGTSVDEVSVNEITVPEATASSEAAGASMPFVSGDVPVTPSDDTGMPVENNEAIAQANTQ